MVDNIRHDLRTNNYPFTAKAYNAVQKAIKNGLLGRLDGSIACVDCGNPATMYDHRDYRKPLFVDPTCRSCNFRRGMAKDLKRWLKKIRKGTQWEC